MSQTDRESIRTILEATTSQAVPSEWEVPSLHWFGSAKDKIFVNAIRRYAPEASLDDCLCAHDMTFRKTGKRGILFTSKGFAADFLEARELGHGQPVRFDELTHVSLASNDDDESYPDIVLHLSDGRSLRSDASIYGHYLHLVVNKLLVTLDPSRTQAHDQLVTLAPLGHLPAMEANQAREQGTPESVAMAAGPAHLAQDTMPSPPAPAERRRGRHFAKPVASDEDEQSPVEAATTEAAATDAPPQESATTHASAPERTAPTSAPRPRLKAIPKPDGRWSRRKFEEMRELAELGSLPEELYQLALHYYHGNGTKRDLYLFCQYLDLAAVQDHQGATDALDFAANSVDRTLSEAYRTYLDGRDDAVHRYFASVADMGDEYACRTYLRLYGKDERYAQSERDVRYTCYLTLAESGDASVAEPMMTTFLEKVHERGDQCQASELEEITTALEKLAAKGDERSKSFLRKLKITFDESLSDSERFEAVLDQMLEEYKRGDQEAATSLVKGCIALFNNPASKEEDRAASLLALGELVHCGNKMALIMLFKVFAEGRLGEHAITKTDRLEGFFDYITRLMVIRQALNPSIDELMEYARGMEFSR